MPHCLCLAHDTATLHCRPDIEEAECIRHLDQKLRPENAFLYMPCSS